MKLRLLATAREVAHRMRAEYTALAGWWLHEMREVGADLSQRLAPSRPHRTTLSLTRTSGTVLQEWRNGTAKSLEFQRTASGDLPQERNDFWPDAVDGTAMRVVLPKSSLLVRRAWIPAGAERNLGPVVELQLERELPIPRDQVQVDWRIETHNADRTKIEVAIAAVWRSEIERLHDALSRWKLRAISIAVDLGSERAAFNFSPRRAYRSSARLASVDRWLLLSAVFLVFAYTVVSGAQWLHERIIVTEALSKTSAPALRVESMRADLEKRGEPVATLQPLMAAASSAEVLSVLTAVVPRDTWLQQLDIRTLTEGSYSIKFIAITPSATALVARLEQSQQFKSVELQSSGAWGVATGRDRAEVSMRWVNESDSSTQKAKIQ